MAGCRSDPRHRRYIENIEPAPDTRNADATPEQRPDIDHGLEPPATAIVAQQNQRPALVRETPGFDVLCPQRHRAILAGCRQASKRRRTVIDVAASAARGLPRPSVRAFTQTSLRLSVDAARACGATALFDGGGGDNMFAALSSLAPVADCLHRDGGTGHFWRAARSIGIATQTSTLTVARMALVRCWTRGPGYRWPVDASLLTAEARVDVRGAAAHPWLEPPPGALAGSAAHVALLVAAQSLVQGRGLRTDLPEVSPLVTQPVAEACLRVPSWLWTRDGHNRAIARDAFRALLPPSIVDRRDKGSPGGFVAELFEANYDRIRILLLDGCLVGNGIVDRVSTNAALREARGMRAHGYRRIMQLVDVEAWARSWS